MNYQKINLFDIANGLGIRVSLFVSGCNFHCKGCFNSQAWDFNSGAPFTEKEEDLIIDRLKHPDFKGLSILGGDPLWQDDDGLNQLIRLCQKVHKLGKDIWIWSGFSLDEIIEGTNPLRLELIKNCEEANMDLINNEIKINCTKCANNYKLIYHSDTNS